MTPPPRHPHPIALAMEWVAKITTVALEMVLPALAGHYFDRRFGSQHWVLVGLAVGMATGLYHLLQMTRKPKKHNSQAGRHAAPHRPTTSSGNSDDVSQQ